MAIRIERTSKLDREEMKFMDVIYFAQVIELEDRSILLSLSLETGRPDCNGAVLEIPMTMSEGREVYRTLKKYYEEEVKIT